jgi:hypothetical protein
LAHGIEFPTSPQRGKTNANQPVLGFDGWGFLRFSGDEYALVLMQVKTTDDVKRPPGESQKLAGECKRVPHEKNAMCRALSVIALLLKDTPFVSIALNMLESLGRNSMPQIVVAPAIIRGNVKADITDLGPVRNVVSQLVQIAGRGLTLSLGVNLADFGRRVVNKAKALQT